MVEIVLKLMEILLQKGAEIISQVISKKNAEKSFRDEIEQWLSGFIARYESTVISGDSFARYLSNYNLLEHFINYIKNPKDLDETAFLQKKLT